jgi:carbon monoxide dehydrogenase subunit G
MRPVATAKISSIASPLRVHTPHGYLGATKHVEVRGLEVDMATIWKEISVDAPLERVWPAVRDVGRAHERLFPGVLTSVHLEQGVRDVTFANGMKVREPIVSIDDAHHRVAWTVEGGSLAHHNASLQVIAEGAKSKIVWITDILPDSAAPAIQQIVDGGAAAMRATLSGKLT